MPFTKQYIQSLADLVTIPTKKRTAYYLNRSLLHTKGGFTKQSEPLVRQAEIEQTGILCKPFWDDEQEGKALDSEGRAFADFRKNHPDFNLMLRKTALAKLLKAQAALPDHLKIVLKASVRPVCVQRAVFDAELALTKQKHSDWDHTTAYKHTLEYVTDPYVNIPPHASGGTIDVALWDAHTNTYVDVGSPINAVDDSSWGDNHDGLNDEQIAMRELLRSTMLAAGFAPLASEWWHFSYGDQRWAVYYDKPAALYGAVELEERQ